jgi:hypothetical protein
MALGTTLPFWPALLFTYLEPSTYYLREKKNETTTSLLSRFTRG